MNNKVLNLVSLFVLFFLAFPCGAEEAVVIALSGNAEITRAGKTIPAHPGTRLQEGDAISVQQGELNLITSNGKLETVQSGTSYTVPSGEKQKGEALNTRLLASLADAAGDYERPTVKGMVRGGEGLQPEFPRNTAILAKDLRFSWQNEADLEGMKFELKKRNPRFSFSHKLADGSSDLLYPEDAPSLEAGVPYYWKVEGYNMLTGEPSETPLVWFQILPAEEEHKVRKELEQLKAMEISEQAKAVLRVGIYTSRQLYGDAHRELNSALKKDPDNAVFRSLLSALEQKMEG